MAKNKIIYNGNTLIDLTGDTVTADKLMQGYTAHDRSGALITGTATGGSGDGYVWQDENGYVHLSDEQGTQTIIDTLNVNASGTYTAPAGHAYSPVVVPSGTAGTPSATKGTVSDHSVSVTPSVTNSAGFISGGSKTGTAVSVSASELVSGTKSITENGTGIDVTNYASVDVSVSGGSSVTVEALSVTQNGTYTAPTGKAYSPVSVNVPTGGSEIVLLGADEVTVSTTSTTITTEKTCSIAVDSKVAGGLVLCLIQDKAGERNGYFCSSVSVNYSNTGLRNWTKRITSTGSKGIQSAGYGVYASAMSYSGGFLTATISSRYNSTNSLTVDGTYSIKFYYIDIDAL